MRTAWEIAEEMHIGSGSPVCTEFFENFIIDDRTNLINKLDEFLLHKDYCGDVCTCGLENKINEFLKKQT